MNEQPEMTSTGSEELTFYGGPLMSLFPILFFVVWAIVQTAVLRVGDESGLVVGMLAGIILGMLFSRESWTPYAKTVINGMADNVAATAIVCWLWAGMFAHTLQAGQFVEGLVWLADSTGVGATLFPMITFLLAALLATGIGTGFGTVVAFATLFFPTGVLVGADPVLLFGAILSGAIFGDNLAPVSDTTIVSAVTQEADIGGVVASRFKYAIIAATGTVVLFVLFGAARGGYDVTGEAQSLFLEASEPAGLIHLVSMSIVIVAAVRGRHIVEAISWGLIAAIGFNLVFGLAAVRDILVFRIPGDLDWAESLYWLPIVAPTGEAGVGVGGSLYTGAVGFFAISILTLLIVSGSRIMIRGKGFEVIQEWSLRVLATNVRRGELTMVGSSALINALITINTAAEIAIAPFISRLGKRFNLNGYRRANILDANTAALGYIFPWSGGVLLGVVEISRLTETYDWFTPEMVVQPAEVAPFVFHGWLLVLVFVFAAWTGFGREYTSDRRSEEVERV